MIFSLPDLGSQSCYPADATMKSNGNYYREFEREAIANGDPKALYRPVKVGGFEWADGKLDFQVPNVTACSQNNQSRPRERGFHLALYQNFLNGLLIL